MKRIIALLGSVWLLTGCAEKIIYKDRTVEVKVPVKCKTPDTFCDKDGSLREGTMNELLGCIYELRQSTRVCK